MPSLSAYKSDLDYSYAPGIFPSMECLTHRPESVRRLLMHSSAAGREGTDRLRALAEDLGVRVEEADRALARISGKENCFAAAVFGKFEDEPDPEKPHVVLHNPGDSGNVGTILRTALGLGIGDVALIRPCVDLFDPKTVRASMGSVFSLRVKVYDRFEEYRDAYRTGSCIRLCWTRPFRCGKSVRFRLSIPWSSATRAAACPRSSPPWDSRCGLKAATRWIP